MNPNGRWAAALLLIGSLAQAQAEGDASAFPAAESLEPERLEMLRGRAGAANVTLESHQDLRSTVNGSVIEAGSMISGAVNIGERALDNFSGVGLFNIVTGSNNAVDAAIGVNFNLQ